MNTNLILEYLDMWNEHELFYKKYTEKKKDATAFSAYLDTLDPDYIRRNFLIVPELPSSTLQTDIPMQEDWYFRLKEEQSVSITKHNRCTPPFIHTHAFFEVIYVLSGTCQHNIFDSTHLMQKGDLCLISPSVTHSIYVDEDSLVINILIRRSNIEDIFFHVLRDQNLISDFLVNSIYLKEYATYLLFHTYEDEEVKKQILEMYMEQFEEDVFSDRIISSMLIIFFTKLVRKYKRTAEIPDFVPTDTSAAHLLHCIVNEHNTITLSELASRLNYSVPYCSHYIKELTGHSFLQLLKRVRFQKAETYLKNTSYSIQKISELLGYENPENFIRAFKKEYGLSPTQYRKK